MGLGVSAISQTRITRDLSGGDLNPLAGVLKHTLYKCCGLMLRFNLDCGGSAPEWQKRAQVARRLTASDRLYATTANRLDLLFLSEQR